MNVKDEISRICETEYEEFLDKSNVVGVALGEKIASGLSTGEECITVFVSKKIKRKNLKRDELISSEYNGFKTDVVEVGEIQAYSLTSTIRPMLFGYSIGPASLNLAGTAGCLVKDKSNYYILSNNHVLAGENQLALDSPIIQAATIDGGVYPKDEIAKLSKFVPINFETATSSPTNYLDAAIARITTTTLVSPSIALIGTVQGINLKPKVGLDVKKAGRTTSLTTGKITYLNATVKVGYSGGKTAVFQNQIITTAMSSPGDSGSLILDKGNFAVALLFAGSSSTTIGTPIQRVLSVLNITIV